MRNIRSIVRWLATPLLLVATVAIGAPRATSPTDMAVVSLRRLNLSGTPAALPAALLPLSGGQRASSARVNAAQGNAVSGAPGQLSRIVVPLGKVDGDAKPDLLDVRASRGTLNAQLISGTGITLWRMAPLTRPADIYAAVFPALINGAPMDFYLLEQFDYDAKRTWTIHAVDGSTGADIWATTGSIQTGTPSTTPPSIPPSVPPLNPGSLPTALPTGLPSGLPSGVPGVPTGLPTTLPSDVPTTVPSVLPTNLLPTGLPVVPTTLPSDVPTTLPSVDVTPPAVPTAAPVPTDLPTAVPTITPPAGARRAAPAAQEDGATPFAGYATGAKAVDVDADGKADFPITQTLAITLADGATLVVSQLTTVSGANGQSIATVVAAGVNAIPYAGVAGNVLGGPGLVAVDEVAGPSNVAATYRMHTGKGLPMWANAGTVPLGTLGLFDATADLTGDGAADLLVARMPTVPGQQDTIVTAFASPLGFAAWSRPLPDSAIVVAGGEIDGMAGADVLTQGLDLADAGKIPSGVVYRALSGQTGSNIYETTVPIRTGGAIGDWSATLTVDAGRIDADATPDLHHAINGIPTTGEALWSQAAVSGKTGAKIWAVDTPLNPGLPVGGNVLGTAAADIIDVQESATRTTDSLVIRASSGADGRPVWNARVLVGGGSERVRSLAVQTTEPGAGGDIAITVVQRSGTGTRSLVVLVKGSTGQVLWIRTN